MKRLFVKGKAIKLYLFEKKRETVVSKDGERLEVYRCTYRLSRKAPILLRISMLPPVPTYVLLILPVEKRLRDDGLRDADSEGSAGVRGA